MYKNALSICYWEQPAVAKDLVLKNEERRQERIRIPKEKERKEIRQYWEEQKRFKKIDKKNKKGYGGYETQNKHYTKS